MTSPLHHCSDCVELLGEYVDGSLPAEKAQALEAHLSICPPCITFVRTYRATRKLCRSALAREMPHELMSSLSSFLGKHVPGFPCSKGDTAAADDLRAAVGDDRAAREPEHQLAAAARNGAGDGLAGGQHVEHAAAEHGRAGHGPARRGLQRDAAAHRIAAQDIAGAGLKRGAGAGREAGGGGSAEQFEHTAARNDRAAGGAAGEHGLHTAA